MNFLELITDPDLGGTSFEYGRLKEHLTDKGRAELIETRHPAQGNIQPAPGKERELLPEGDRAKASIIIYTPAALLAGQEATKADRIYYGGETYRVALVEAWQQAGNFTKAIAVKESV